MSIILIQAAKQKPLIAVSAAIGMFFLNPLIQSTSTSLAFQIWFADIFQKPLNASLYVGFSVLFGMFVSLYLFSKNQCIDCKPNVKSGIGGSALGFMLGVCPACLSFIGFLLPLSGSLFLTTYSPLFMLVSIGIIVFSIYKMSGFRSIITSSLN
ncbi:MAG: hypothetical protein EPO63_06140 [Candidatus Nitrosotenuis sp.]|nr:MAG: hypothetical protein EPO63_06140 [Candidatus Nitrosotenuis sp.]